MSDLYAVITSQIVELLKQGVIPWHSGIVGDSSQPRNYQTERPYRGLNILLLNATARVHGYHSPYWLTFNQVRAKGGHVRKGEQATLVIFWKLLQIEDEENKRTVPVLRYYHVFNLEQTQGLPAQEVPPEQQISFNPIAEAERIIRDYEGRPEIIHEGNAAYYRPAVDKIVIPPPERFAPREEYYATLFHELIHSTGHAERLNRTGEHPTEQHRTPEYAKEELIAEMGAAFLCGHCHIAQAVIQNQAAYIEGWLRLLGQDHRLIVTAASAAQKAVDWILEPCKRKSASERLENADLPPSLQSATDV